MRLENQPPQMCAAQKPLNNPPGMPLHPKTAATSTAQTIQTRLSPESQKIVEDTWRRLERLLEFGFCD